MKIKTMTVFTATNTVRALLQPLELAVALLEVLIHLLALLSELLVRPLEALKDALEDKVGFVLDLLTDWEWGTQKGKRE